jgi:hypothetical protein
VIGSFALLATTIVSGYVHVSFARALPSAGASTRLAPARIASVPNGSTGSAPSTGPTPASVVALDVTGRYSASLTLFDDVGGLDMYLECNNGHSQLQIASSLSSELSLSIVSYSDVANGASAFTEYAYFPSGAGDVVLPEYGITGSDLLTFSFHPRPPSSSPIDISGTFAVSNTGKGCSAFGTAEEAKPSGAAPLRSKHSVG